MKTEHLATIRTIDDDANLRQIFRHYPEDHYFKVLDAEDGSIGVEVFQRESPDHVNDVRGLLSQIGFSAVFKDLCTCFVS